MGKRLFGLGTGTLCLSLFCLLLNRTGSPAYVASMCALVASLALLALSFTAPFVVRRLLDPKPEPRRSDTLPPRVRGANRAHASR